LTRQKLDVEVTIGVQRPDLVKIEEIKALLPVGNPSVKAVKGGLDVADPEHDDVAVIASAAIAVRVDVSTLGKIDKSASAAGLSKEE
jgi:NADPH-dependent curcumin reductase CurA